MIFPSSFCLLGKHTFPINSLPGYCLEMSWTKKQLTHPSPSGSPRSARRKRAPLLPADAVTFSDEVRSLTYTTREGRFHMAQRSQGVFHLTFQPLFSIGFVSTGQLQSIRSRSPPSQSILSILSWNSSSGTTKAYSGGTAFLSGVFWIGPLNSAWTPHPQIGFTCIQHT